MGRINLQNDLFLGLQELNRQDSFLKERGYLKILSSLINNFGIVYVDEDSSFDNFKIQTGTNSGTIKLSLDSYALDKNMNIIFQKTFDNLSITNDSNWYWVKISFTENSLETGQINISANGNVTGIGTTFSEVLRDQSNYPVKINFPNSSNNTGDYQVVSVLSDTQAILSGATSFTDENGLDFKVVGSFTPGISLSGENRFPYVYDSCLLELVQEITPDTEPEKTAGEEFFIARVKNVSGSITIHDKRIETLTSAKKDSGWIQPTLEIAITNVSGQEVKYRKNYIGEVEIRGSFTTSVGTSILFTLPTNYRPINTIHGIYSYSDGSVIRTMSVDSSGVVRATTAFPFHTSNTNEIITLKFNII